MAAPERLRHRLKPCPTIPVHAERVLGSSRAGPAAWVAHRGAAGAVALKAQSAAAAVPQAPLHPCPRGRLHPPCTAASAVAPRA